MLARVRAALPVGGRLVLRVGDAAARRGFAASSWVDRVVTLARGQGFGRHAGRTLAAWHERARRARLRGRERADARRHAVRERPPRRHRRARREGAGADAMTPATLDHAGIEALIPHRGADVPARPHGVVGRDADRVRRRQSPRPAPSAAQRERPAGERGDRVRGAGDGGARRALRRSRRRPRRARLSGQRARRAPRLLAPRRSAARRRPTSSSSSPSGRPPTRRASSTRSFSATTAASSPSGRVAVVLDAALANAR